MYQLEVYRCNLCSTEFPARPPDGVGEEKYDERAASMIALLRYGWGMPHSRLARLQAGFKVPLPSSTQWEVVHDAAESLKPVLRELARQAAQGRLVLNDDTTMPVQELIKANKKLKAEYEAAGKKGKEPRTGMFSSLILSVADGRPRIGLFFTGRRHAGENLKRVLAERADSLEPPLQMTDGLESRNVPRGIDTLVSNCLVHGRRKFVYLIESFPAACKHVIETLGTVYHNDARAREMRLSDQRRLAFHQKHSKPLMDDLERWMRAELDEKRVEENGTLGQAMNYMLKRWERLTRFLTVAGAPLDNNVTERGLKRAIVHRKNSLFYRTLAGAEVGDTYMSLIYCAEQADANPFEYLVALLENERLVAEAPADWMPWNYQRALDRVEL